jgi:hypothetical protein
VLAIIAAPLGAVWVNAASANNDIAIIDHVFVWIAVDDWRDLSRSAVGTFRCCFVIHLGGSRSMLVYADDQPNSFLAVVLVMAA